MSPFALRLLKIALPISVAAALAATVVPRAMAAAKHIEHGAGCHFFFGSPAPFGEQHRGDGLMHQDTAATQDAICALERSNTTNTTGLLDLEIRLVQLQGKSVTVLCDAGAQRTDGSTVKFINKTGTGTHIKIDFGAGLNASTSGGSYFVGCSLPAFTTIQSVFSSEP
jgi:hypothetical protein